MQHDHASGIALLLDDSDRNAVPLCTFPEVGQQLKTFARLRRKPLVRRYRVKDVQLGFAHASHAQRPVERVTASLAQIDGAQDLLDRCHT
jgi:hypothetical protein